MKVEISTFKLTQRSFTLMKKQSNIKLNLSPAERKKLRFNKMKISEILDFAVDELEVILGVTAERAKEIRALAEFQKIRSVGIRSAEDLIFLGCYSLTDVKGKDGVQLTDAFERKKGYWIDPCVEDVFRLVAHVANTNDYSKNWWDFTEERKKYRRENGYPSDRPRKAWHEILIKKNN